MGMKSAQPNASHTTTESPRLRPMVTGWKSKKKRSTANATTAAFDAGSGQLPSWESIVEEHADEVYRLALRLTGNQHDAEDLTQETFLKIFKSLHTYKPGTFGAWARRICTNLFLDKVRREQTIRMEALPDNIDMVSSSEKSPEQAWDDADLDPTVRAALDSLPPDYRAAVVLCDVEGLSYDEIAETLGVKIGTVRSRIHRARAAMRNHLLHDQDFVQYLGS